MCWNIVVVRRNFEVYCREVHEYMLADNVTVFFNSVLWYQSNGHYSSGSSYDNTIVVT
jgi:hypothetical protein